MQGSSLRIGVFQNGSQDCKQLQLELSEKMNRASRSQPGDRENEGVGAGYGDAYT